jgi:hypothetical protein
VERLKFREVYINVMGKVKEPTEMSRDELLHELVVLEAANCQEAPASWARSGSLADLALELQYLKRASTPSP